MNKTYLPLRSEFVNIETYLDPGNFSFHEVNGGDYDVAIFSIASELQAIRNSVGKGLAISSGYRNPLHNAGLDPAGAENSRHIYGDAADILVRDFDGDGDIDSDDGIVLRDEAVTHGAAWTKIYPHHVHMDWR